MLQWKVARHTEYSRCASSRYNAPLSSTSMTAIRTLGSSHVAIVADATMVDDVESTRDPWLHSGHVDTTLPCLHSVVHPPQ